MTRHILVALIAILFVQNFSPTTAHAQVSTPYMNVLCAWHPFIAGNYEILVYEQPGQTLIHTITDPAITSQACTFDEHDLLQWVQNDLTSNGTLFGTNDQFDTQIDAFCPGPDVPSINSLMANMTFHPRHGAPQAGLVLNYKCPVTGGGGGGGTPAVPDVTYTANTCGEPSTQVTVWFDEVAAVSMLELNNTITIQNHDAWQTSLIGVAAPAPINSFIPSSATHCDQELVDVAQAYVQDHISALNPADFGIDAWSCPTDDLVVAITQCTDHGTHSTYGYQIDCCPPAAPTIVTTNFTTMNACLFTNPQMPSMTLAQPTQFLSPAAPSYNDPNTVCQDAEADALAWFDDNLPTGTPPCFMGWGAAAGGTYVTGSFNFRWCTVTPGQNGCDFNVSWSQEYQCMR